jgi:hypothetical protein
VIDLRRMLALAAVALVGVMAFAPTVWGAAQPLAGGKARLALNRGLLRAMKEEGIVLRALRPARLRGRILTLPVTSGAYDRDASSALFAHSGGLELAAGGRSVALRRLTLNASSGVLTATVAGRRMRLAKLGRAELSPDGFDARLVARRLPLARAAATALNRALRLAGAFRPGRSLGSVNALGKAAAVEIAFGTIAIGGPETTFSKLQSREVQLGIWGGSERWGGGAETYFLFGVDPTVLPPDASAGVLGSDPDDGISMEIQAPPPRNMLLRGPSLDLGARELSATVSSLSGADPTRVTVATLDYGAATFQVRPRVGVFELMGIRAVATQFVADQLNARFETPGLFQAGETFARITVTLHAAGPTG